MIISIVSLQFTDTTFGTKISPGDKSNEEFLKAANMYVINCISEGFNVEHAC